MWEWLGSNSGQIQIIIALGALYLAFKGYKKILRQIEISQEQERVANIQRGVELKVQSMNLSIMALDRSGILINNLEEIYTLSKRVLKSLDENDEDKKKDIEELIDTIRSKLEGSKEAQEEIILMCNTINKIDILHDSTILKSLYELLILTVSDKNLSDSMKHHFVKTEN